jgi:hypothetical protein
MHARNILVAAVAIAALAGPSAATAAPQAGPKVRLAVFFERGGALWQSSRTVAQTPGVAAAAIRAVFAGPNPPETAAGVGSAVPTGSRLRGISVSGGTATVDVSRAFAAAGDRASVRMRVAQLVYTATQFPAIDHVRLEIAGTVVHSIAGTPVPQPAARPSFYRLLPAILVAQPAIGERIPATATIAGSADVFEAALTVRIVNAKGRLLALEHITASCGTGCRGTYTATLHYQVVRSQPGTVVIFDSGGTTAHPHVVRVPVRLTAR